MLIRSMNLNHTVHMDQYFHGNMPGVQGLLIKLAEVQQESLIGMIVYIENSAESDMTKIYEYYI